jgi:hypothetical protein
MNQTLTDTNLVHGVEPYWVACTSCYVSNSLLLLYQNLHHVPHKSKSLIFLHYRHVPNAH